MKLRICDKVAAGGQLSRMCGWFEPDRVKLSGDDSLSAYLLEPRARPIGGTVLPLEQLEHQSLRLENGENGEESRRQGVEG